MNEHDVLKRANTNQFNFTNNRNALVNVYFMYIRFQMHRLDTVDFM